MSYQNGIINNLIENTIEIYFADDPDPEATKITQSNIVSESMTLKQSVCDSETLTYGGCIASEFNIELLNTADRSFSSALTGKWISVKITQHYADPDALLYPANNVYPADSLFPGKTTGEKAFWVFSGYIDSAMVNKTDKNVIDVVAYDVFAKLYEEDATNWLYTFLKSSSGIYAGNISNILYHALSIDYNNVLDIAHSNISSVLNERYTAQAANTIVGSFRTINDSWLSRKDKISFGELIKSICEILAVFGVIVPNSGKGVFVFKTLSGTAETYAFYESLEAEEYQSTGYTDFQFNISGNDRTGKSTLGGGITDAADGAVNKAYDFTDNILVMQPYTTSGQGRTSTDFDYLINRSSIGTRLALNAESANHSGQCAFSAYTPLTATLDGRLWVTVGSPIEILVNQTDANGDYIITDGQIQKESVKTYVLSRTLTGIQALTDDIEVKGVR